MKKKEQNELILDTASKLTNTRQAWKIHSPVLMGCYNGLHPLSLSKLCHILFETITYNKRHYAKTNSKFDAYEEERIYNSLWYSLEDILRRAHPVKYQFEKKDVGTDVSNLKKALRQLEKMNIFYIWKYRQPYNYLFFMEEDILLWTYYNSSAYVSPNTLSKILFGANGAIQTMVSFEKQAKREVSLSDVENSFGDFLNRMIDKMNPSVAKKLSRWVADKDIHKYIELLEHECCELKPYAGVEISEEFMQKLPENIASKLETKVKEVLRKIKKGKGKEMNITDLASLVPQDGNLVRQRKTRTKKSVSKNNGINAEISRFPRVNPFKDSNSFITFYRSNLRSYITSPRFSNFGNERHIAEEILDTLTDNGHQTDINFLKGWIKYYATRNLTGRKGSDIEKTCLSAFRKSFDTFNSSYVN